MSSDTSKKPKTEISCIVKGYLIGYNVIETFGWAYVLYLFINYLLFASFKQSLYDSVKCPLLIFQNAAILEVIHAAIKIVPSNPQITAMQVASRLMVVNGVLMATESAQQSLGLYLCLTAWSITEIIRYSNYALNLLEAVPHLITWLRYSTFIILYPIGVTGELLCIFAAQNEVGRTKLFTLEMPNSVNFIFNYQFILWVTMAAYIPFFPQLYMHMFSLRRKVLGGKKDKQQ